MRFRDCVSVAYFCMWLLLPWECWVTCDLSHSTSARSIALNLHMSQWWLQYRHRERGRGQETEVTCLVSSRQVGVLRLKRVFTSSPNSISFPATFLCSSSTSSLRILHSRSSLSSKMWWKDLFDRGVKHIVYIHGCVLVFGTVCELSWPLNFSSSQMSSTSWFGLHHQASPFLRLLVASAHVISKSLKSCIDIFHTRRPCGLWNPSLTQHWKLSSVLTLSFFEPAENFCTAILNCLWAIATLVLTDLHISLISWKTPETHIRMLITCHWAEVRVCVN